MNKQVEIIASALDAHGATDIQIIDITGVSILADYFVVASGSTAIQVRALCEAVCSEVEKAGLICRHVEGMDAGRWVVIDVGDVMVHVFHTEERAFYNLERLWSNGENTVVFGTEK